MNKLKLHTKDFVSENILKIAELFPHCVTEAKDEGRGSKDENPETSSLNLHPSSLKIDFDLLRQELSKEIVEGPQERYRLDWPGKRESLALANAPITKTLRPCKEESVDFETTKNLYIEGDNLDALKLLQETYLGKVKMIYIDPPYNTGNDFIYDDSFSMSREEYEESSGEKDEEGNAMFDEEKWKQNSSASGRFHSEWLSMIYPRLKLARNLLREDGVLLVSMNEAEIGNLRSLLVEIFGESNRLECFVWNNEGNVDQQSKIKGVHEYILAFIRSSELLNHPEVVDPNIEETSKLFNERIENSITKNGPANPPSTVTLPVGFPAGFEEGEIACRDDKWPHVTRKLVVSGSKLAETGEVYSGWSSRNLLDLFIANGCNPINDSAGKKTWFELTPSGAIYGIKERSDLQGHVLSVIRNVGTTKQNGNRLKAWGIPFSYPKPLLLIHYLLRVFSVRDSDLVLDFFSGAATTAHAVMQLNAEDGGQRRHIQIQIPEPCNGTSDAFKAGFSSIAEIGKERIRCAGREIQTELEARLGSNTSKTGEHEEIRRRLESLDTGFRVLKIDSSNMADVYYQPDQLTQEGLALQVDNVKPDRKPEDLLFQVLLDWGIDLASPIEKDEVRRMKDESKDEGGRMKDEFYRVFWVGGNDLVACFDTAIEEDLVKHMAKRQPLRAVFRDAGYASDSTKINIEQIFKALSPQTELKTL